MAVNYSVNATTLTFEGLSLGDFGVIPGSYGDNVTSTSEPSWQYGMGNGFKPDITVEYRTVFTSPIIKIRFGPDWSVGIDNINFDQVPIEAVPEPTTFVLLGIGLAGFAGGVARKKWMKIAANKTR